MTSEAQAIASARGLTKRFGRKTVLRGIDFTIPSGRIYGLVGHNGAGKTTTLNALLGLTDCEGQIEVLGIDPFKNRARLMNDVAFVSDVASLPRFLKVRELLDLVADIHPKFDRSRAVSFLEGTDVMPDLKIKTLSKGMIAQLHLAVVMAIDARLLVLDEPTLGLDILYRKRFYKRLIEDYMTEHRTLLITTHQVDEIESLLTDVMFMREGRVILDAPTEDIGHQFAQVIVAKDKTSEAEALMPIYSETRFGQTVMVFENIPPDKLNPLGDVSTPSLSDLFVALMQREGEA
ncbi:ABC transporter ATP-binding protein [Nitratireductor sp. XY-223]|uniref:ABC transporter ATP-binding protein n=1 Tax=Nitratireductor sp. XY-223 TaxID=2561926 RepID=UPI0010AA4D0A|nr:ABC transporter ATP-binding protein [Nitratireductor sp. XY-223]